MVTITQMRLMSRSKKGFSLIELLVVISIIGILVAIGMASYTNIQQKARDATRRTDIQAIAQAMEQYYQDNSAYPTGVALGVSSKKLATSNTNHYQKDSLKFLNNLVFVIKTVLMTPVVLAATDPIQGANGTVDPEVLAPYFSGPFPTDPKSGASYHLTVDANSSLFCTCAQLESQAGGNAGSPSGFGVCNFEASAADFGQWYCQTSRQ